MSLLLALAISGGSLILAVEVAFTIFENAARAYQVIAATLMASGGIIAAWVLAERMIHAFAWKSRPFDDPRCLICDYDLTGNTSRICPECGTRLGDVYIGYTGDDAV